MGKTDRRFENIEESVLVPPIPQEKKGSKTKSNNCFLNRKMNKINYHTLSKKCFNSY